MHVSRKIFTCTTEGIGKRGRVSYFPGVLTPGNQKDPVSISFTIKRLGFNIIHCILYLEIVEELRGFFGYFPPWQRDGFFGNTPSEGQIAPPEKHLKCHDKMAGNISVTRFDPPVQDGGEHIS